MLMKMDRLTEDFIEGMACEGGCVGGPSSFSDQNATKKTREDMISCADCRTIIENLANYDLTAFSQHR